MTFTQYIQVDSEKNDQRIDNFLISKFKLPKALIYRWIRKAKVRVNKKRTRQTYRIKCGDIIRIPPFHINQKKSIIKKVTNDHLSFLESLIIFENSNYMVVNKPSGIAVHGGSGIDLGFIERLRQLRPQVKKLELVHRLDKETSGCLLIAKKHKILTYFHEIFKNRNVTKHYHALVHGTWPKKIKLIDLPLTRHLSSHGERMVYIDNKQGKESITKVNIVQKFDNYTLIEVIPYTGRTHQIRVHCANFDCPIVYDKKYGNIEKDRILKKITRYDRLFLHSTRLAFQDPETNRQMSFVAKYDTHINQFLKYISDNKKNNIKNSNF